MLTTNKTQSIEIMHKKLDKFIQSCLNKFKFVEVKSDIYTKVGKDKNSIISHKSTIPDLVIWNKPFNKNECFCFHNNMKDLGEYNKYPRIPFYLRLNNKEQNNSIKKYILTQDEFSPIETLVNFVDKLNIKEESSEAEENVEFKYENNINNITNYITPINKSKQTMNDYYQNQFKRNELLMNYVYSFLDTKGWFIFTNDGVYLSF